MRIRRLVLSEYRRHQHTDLELPDGVTAVLGRNGSGKSTLLEAIGFALFGPAATRTAKDLLRRDGAAPTDPVRVELELELQGQALRIVRELRGRNLTPQASLEADGIVIVPTGAGSGDAVTKEMERRLGMDREGFFTTVVARQKELARLADERPADRKRLILSMLGVDRIEEAIRRAREARRSAEGQVEALRRDRLDAKQLEAEADAIRQAVREAEQAVAAAEKAWAKAKQNLDSAVRAAEQAEHAERAAEAARRAVTQQQRDLQELRMRIQDMEQAVRNAEEAARRRRELGDTAQEVATAEAAWEAARAHMETLRARDAALAARAREERSLADARTALEGLQIPAAPDLDAARKVVAAAEAERDAATALLVEVDAEVRNLRDQQRRLAALGPEAPCPTCTRPLGAHLATIQREAENRFAILQQRRVTAQAEQQDAEARRARALEALDAAYKLEQERAAALHKKEALERQVTDLERRIAAIEVPEDPGPAPEIAPLEQARATARRRHEEALRLESEAASLQGRQEALAAARKKEAEQIRSLEEAEQILRSTPEEPEVWQAAKQAREVAAAAERDAERNMLEARRRQATIMERAAGHARLVAQEERVAARLKEAEEAVQYWTALAGIRGGGLLDAFKEHLVQRVGPAIAHEASRLLASFTEGRYTEVLLDESYEVYVSDGGVPYTLDRFSGGEADLVHLALRLAVSRLLAERSGAELRFLALDEVFGGLDATRRDAVVAALHGLGGLYQQVLMVTHLDSLRDALDHAMIVEDRGGRAVVTVT